MAELTPTLKALAVIDEINSNGEITNAKTRELTGLTGSGARRLLSETISLVIPVVYCAKRRSWITYDKCEKLACDSVECK